MDSLEVGSGTVSDEMEEKVEKGPLKDVIIVWTQTKSISIFFPEFEPVGGVCLGEKENRTSFPEVVGVGEVLACNQTSDCQAADVNFQCREGQCVCRDHMKYDK